MRNLDVADVGCPGCWMLRLLLEFFPLFRSQPHAHLSLTMVETSVLRPAPCSALRACAPLSVRAPRSPRRGFAFGTLWLEGGLVSCGQLSQKAQVAAQGLQYRSSSQALFFSGLFSLKHGYLFNDGFAHSAVFFRCGSAGAPGCTRQFPSSRRPAPSRRRPRRTRPGCGCRTARTGPFRSRPP